MIYTVAVPIACTFLSYVVFHCARTLFRTWTSSLRFIDGPPSPSFVFGHSVVYSDVPETGDQWRERYGQTFMAKGIFGADDLHTTNVKAVAHILRHGSLYPRTPEFLSILTHIFGAGLLSVDLDPHRRQRKIIHPAFSAQQIRLMNEGFLEQAIVLRDFLAADVRKAGGSATVNLGEMFRQVTLDIIGEAGFGYKFNSLQSGGKNEGDLSEAFRLLFHVPSANLNNAVQIAQGAIPVLRFLPLPGWRSMQFAKKTMKAVGTNLMQKAKAEAQALGEKELGSGRDLLSILVKANMSADIPNTQRLSDSEIIAQVPTFLAAGHETSSAALGWAVHVLSHHPAVQDKLRKEMLSIPTDTPTMDELNALPFFEAVLREILRLYAPLAFIQRVATRDDVLPLNKPYVDQLGVAHETLPCISFTVFQSPVPLTNNSITKGQMITIPIRGINTDKEIWGEDALEFKPERWNNLPDAVGSVPAVWGNQLTFLAGAHSCIGFRFSLVEQKAILFSLLQVFEFLPGTEPVGSVISAQLRRPSSFVSDGKGGRVSMGGLSLVVKAYQESS
ncbi:unnamed protein product [Mycena citricolor]|uniref:Cytochrome P450 n=1 Tax=Mycena citricolor TaxID=2018698 RepID=A0AAD2JYV5_9AGAR|nr:unnamed protein product [Mycena citricolor]